MRFKTPLRVCSQGTGGSKFCPFDSVVEFLARFSKTRNGLDKSCKYKMCDARPGAKKEISRNKNSRSFHEYSKNTQKTYSCTLIIQSHDKCHSEWTLGMRRRDHQRGALEVHTHTNSIERHVSLRRRKGRGAWDGGTHKAFRSLAIKIHNLHPDVASAGLADAFIFILSLVAKSLRVLSDAFPQ